MKKHKTKAIGKSLNQKPITFANRLSVLHMAIKQISEGDAFIASGLLMNELDNMLAVAHKDKHEWLESIPHTVELRAILGKIRDAVAKKSSTNLLTGIN